MKSPFVLALFVLIAGGCSSPSEPPLAITSSSVPPSPPASVVHVKPIIKKKIAPVPKPVKTPEAECDEVISKLRDAGLWEKEFGSPRTVGSVYVEDDGTLNVGLCNWFCGYSDSQMMDYLGQIQKIWASVHSPDAPCKSKLECDLTNLKKDTPITIKVDCTGFSQESAEKLIRGCSK